MPFNLRENLTLKIFSFLLAVLCWVVVKGEVERIRDFTVPLDYVNLPENLALSGEVTDTVSIRLRAAEAVLRTITADRLTARIDLSHVPSGEQHMQLTEEMIEVPGGAEVVRITPALLPLTIEKRTTRKVPVVAEFAGTPAPGYSKVGHVLMPSEVTIAGPESEVAGVRRALTGTIVLEGTSEDLVLEVQPIPDAPPGSRVQVVSPRGPVRVEVNIRAPRPVEPQPHEATDAGDAGAAP